MAASLPAAAAMLALAGTPASVGVGIQAGPVCPATTVAQGGTYALPPVQVADTGSGSVDISLAVIRMTDPRSTLHGEPVPPSWVTFTYPRKWFGLAPGSSVHVGHAETALVPARLAIPSSAAPGAYLAWIQPSAAGADVPGHANLAGTGEADLEFTVTPAGVPPRHAACVTPGAKAASHPAAARGTGQAAPAASMAEKVTGREMQIAAAAVAVLAVLALLRRRRA